MKVSLHQRLFCLILLVFILAATPVPAAQITPKRIVMQNGLTLLFVARPSPPLVSMEMLIQAGSLFDPEGRSGMANLTASLLDEGTKKRTSKQIAEEIDFIGAGLSATAEEDYTTIHLKVLKKDLHAGMNLFSEVIRSPTFNTPDVERVRHRLLGTILSEQDEPETLAYRAFQEIVFQGHPYRHPVNGRAETLPLITREDLVSFHQNYYRPNNATLAIVGDVTEREAMQLVEQYFGAWQRRSLPSRKISPPSPMQNKTLKLIDKDLTQASVLLGHLGVARTDPDYYAISVMNYILGGGGFSSRMMAEIRDRQGLVYGISSRFAGQRHPGPFTISLQTRTDRANQAIDSVLKEMNQMRATPVSETELLEAKAYLTGSFPLRIDTAAKLATLLPLMEYHQLGLDYFKKYPGYINAVTREEVLRVARKYLNPEHYALVVVAKQAEAKIKE